MNKFDKVFILSGSFSSKILSNFANHGILKLNNDFPMENRQIKSHGDFVLNRKNIDEMIPLITSRIEDIVRENKGNTIVHVTSYKLQKDIIEEMVDSWELDNDIYYNENTSDLESVLKDFKESDKGVLISPSIATGVDFPGNEARNNILVKIPYPPLDYESRVWYSFNQYYDVDTVEKIVQAYGRCMRSKNDFQNFFILDSLRQNLKKVAKKYFPYFWEPYLDHLRDEHRLGELKKKRYGIQ